MTEFPLSSIQRQILLDIMSRYGRLESVVERRNFFDTTGYSTIPAIRDSISVDLPTRDFCPALLRTLQDQGNLPHSTYHALYPLLSYLRSEVLGHETQLIFIDEILVLEVLWREQRLGQESPASNIPDDFPKKSEEYSRTNHQEQNLVRVAQQSKLDNKNTRGIMNKISIEPEVLSKTDKELYDVKEVKYKNQFFHKSVIRPLILSPIIWCTIIICVSSYFLLSQGVDSLFNYFPNWNLNIYLVKIVILIVIILVEIGFLYFIMEAPGDDDERELLKNFIDRKVDEYKFDAWLKANDYNFWFQRREVKKREEQVTMQLEIERRRIEREKGFY